MEDKNKLIVSKAIYEDYTISRIMDINGKSFIELYYYNNDIKNYIIQNLFVSEKERNKKFASILLDFCIKTATEENADRLNLYATKDSWMWNWYKRLGFQEDEKMEDSEYTWMFKQLIKN